MLLLGESYRKITFSHFELITCCALESFPSQCLTKDKLDYLTINTTFSDILIQKARHTIAQ